MEITTERLILRAFKQNDWPAVLAYQREPLYLRYYDWEDRTPLVVQEFIQMFLDSQRQQPRIKFQLAITLKASQKLIGNCGVRMDTIDARQGDIGYELSPDQWGKGYATEAAHAIVEFGFSHLELHRIWAECVADNTGSARVLQKLGMRGEGCLRENKYYKGRWWDTLLFGMLEHEWRTAPG